MFFSRHLAETLSALPVPLQWLPFPRRDLTSSSGRHHNAFGQSQRTHFHQKTSIFADADAHRERRRRRRRQERAVHRERQREGPVAACRLHDQREIECDNLTKGGVHPEQPGEPSAQCDVKTAGAAGSGVFVLPLV